MSQRSNLAYAHPTRSRFLLLLFVAGFAALAIRAAYLQGWNNDFLRAKGESRYSRVIEIPANRGRISDRNGEVLALVSKPTFDPNLFVDGIDVDNWRALNESIDKPLLNRALRGTYPPGSTFKPFMAMAALNTGKRAPTTVIQDSGTFQFGNHTFRSHGDHGLGAVDMMRSIVLSSNVYYYSLANEMGVDLIHEQLRPFGFGIKTEIGRAHV